MYCPECGAFNPEDARYCGSCGMLLKKVVTPTTTQTATTKEQVYQEPIEQIKGRTQNVAPTSIANSETYVSNEVSPIPKQANNTGAPVVSAIPLVEPKVESNKTNEYVFLKKDETTAIILSFFLPGIGSVYGGRMKIGLIIFLIWAISWAIPYIGILMAFALWIYGLFHASETVRAHNRFLRSNGRRPKEGEI